MKNVKNTTATPLHSLEVTAGPWQQLHIDFAGPFQGQTWLIIVDSFSKWPEVVPMHSTTATRTIEELHLIFSCFGLPDQIISDNRPAICVGGVQRVCQTECNPPRESSPVSPQVKWPSRKVCANLQSSNEKMACKGGDVNQKLSNSLLTYRKTPQSTTIEASAMLLMKRIYTPSQN